MLTKLDGTAKGGVILGIADQLKIPVRYVGIGERVEDLRAFDPRRSSWKRFSRRRRRAFGATRCSDHMAENCLGKGVVV